MRLDERIFGKGGAVFGYIGVVADVCKRQNFYPALQLRVILQEAAQFAHFVLVMGGKQEAGHENSASANARASKG